MSDWTSVIVSLNSRNYATWKIQCRMALIRDGFWLNVNGIEIAPGGTAEAARKFASRRDKSPHCHCTLSRPIIAVFTWQSTSPKSSLDQASKTISKKDMGKQAATEEKTLFIKLKKGGGSLSEHIKNMTEFFGELSEIGDAVNEEDRVVHILTSLPEYFNVLVTALEAQSEYVPKWKDSSMKRPSSNKKVKNQ